MGDNDKHTSDGVNKLLVEKDIPGKVVHRPSEGAHGFSEPETCDTSEPCDTSESGKTTDESLTLPKTARSDVDSKKAYRSKSFDEIEDEAKMLTCQTGNHKCQDLSYRKKVNEFADVTNTEPWIK